MQLVGTATASFEACSIIDSVPEYPSLPGQPDELVPAVIHLGSDGSALLLDTPFSGQECQAAPKEGGMFGPGSETSSPALETVPCVASTGVSAVVNDAPSNTSTAGGVPAAGSGGIEDGVGTLQPLPVPDASPADGGGVEDADPDILLPGEPPDGGVDGQGEEVGAPAVPADPEATTGIDGGGDELKYGGGPPLGAVAARLQARKVLQSTGIQNIIAQQAATSGAQLFTDDDIQARAPRPVLCSHAVSACA